MAEIDYLEDYCGPDTAGPRVGKWVNLSGAIVSLALLGGLSVWGYKLLVRDVTGVPVVQAMEGAFRVAPDDPGGMTAPHQGLAVNEIAAGEEASGEVETVTLAPAPMEPSEEDRTAARLAQIREREAARVAAAEAEAEARRVAEEAEAQRLAAEQSDEDAVMAEIDAIMAEADGEAVEMTPVDPAREETAEMDAATAGMDAATVEDTPSEALATDLAVAEALGAIEALPEDAATQPRAGSFASSPRPEARPMRVSAVSTVSSEPAVATTSPSAGVVSGDEEIPVDALEAGTRLVQLGAFASPDVAREEWTRIVGKFPDYFAGKRRVVQRAESGGKAFYRLRAEGFEDLADTRRFCSALVAGQTDCIPVELR